jgi:hypothetical protein
VLKRVGQTQRLAPSGASEVVSEAKVVPRQAEEVIRADVEVIAAANDRRLSLVTWQAAFLHSRLDVYK